jgi:small-conductance mechanosensitive channel
MRIGFCRAAGAIFLAGAALGAAVPAAPVVFEGKTLFTLQRAVGSFSPQERAGAVVDRLNRLVATPGARIRVVPDAPGATETEIAGDSVALLVVTEEDARAAGKPRPELAAEYARSMNAALEGARESRGIRRMIFDTAMALGLAALLFGLLRVQGILFRRLRAKLYLWRGTRIRSLRIQSVELLPAQKIARILIAATRLVQGGVVLLIFYLFLSLMLGILPETRGISTALLAYVLATAGAAWHAISAAAPGLFMIVFIGVVTWYILKLCRLLFREVGRGTITIHGFFPEWGDPTYKLVRILVLAFAVVVAFPYIPGGNSPAFRGVSIFFGVLLSLGSAGAVGNIVAGVLLTYTRAFHIGDRVKIADTLGDVTERTLLATRLRTVKNEEVTVPNSLMLSGQIVNFSACCRGGALILHTSVTIGYDAPWRQVHQLLITAAMRTDRILADPKPFVLQNALDDFYVSYQVNAYTDRPSDMMQIYSDLHQNIQDEFNTAGMEICSPHFGALRDANRIAIPREYVPKDYVAPAFRVSTRQSEEGVKGVTDGYGGA